MHVATELISALLRLVLNISRRPTRVSKPRFTSAVSWVFSVVTTQLWTSWWLIMVGSTRTHFGVILKQLQFK